MFIAYKYRIYPTEKQYVLINKHIGACRFIYNIALETKDSAYRSGFNIGRFELQRQLRDLKNDLLWLKEVNAQSLQVCLINLENSYKRFFVNKNGFPNFKKKSESGKFTIPQAIRLTQNKIYIPKFREGIDIVLHRPIKGEIRQATISRTSTGKYFVSILCETGEENKPKCEIKESTTVGIDFQYQ